MPRRRHRILTDLVSNPLLSDTQLDQNVTGYSAFRASQTGSFDRTPRGGLASALAKPRASFGLRLNNKVVFFKHMQLDGFLGQPIRVFDLVCFVEDRVANVNQMGINAK